MNGGDAGKANIFFFSLFRGYAVYVFVFTWPTSIARRHRSAAVPCSFSVGDYRFRADTERFTRKFPTTHSTGRFSGHLMRFNRSPIEQWFSSGVTQTQCRGDSKSSGKRQKLKNIFYFSKKILLLPSCNRPPRQNDIIFLHHYSLFKNTKQKYSFHHRP